jgi:hypothetical protein
LDGPLDGMDHPHSSLRCGSVGILSLEGSFRYVRCLNRS